MGKAIKNFKSATSGNEDKEPEKLDDK